MTILYLKNKRISSGRITKPWATKNLFQVCGHLVSLLFVSGTKKTEEILYTTHKVTTFIPSVIYIEKGNNCPGHTHGKNQRETGLSPA